MTKPKVRKHPKGWAVDAPAFYYVANTWEFAIRVANRIGLIELSNTAPRENG